MNKKKSLEKQNADVKLTGTFISVMLLGIVMVVSWFGSYILFLTR